MLKAPKSEEDTFLPPDQAFRFDALAEGSDRVRLNWEIAEGYYLYRARIKVSTGAPNVQLGVPADARGPGEERRVLRPPGGLSPRAASRPSPVARAGGRHLEVPLEVTYQGCADAGLCYPPITKNVTVQLPGRRRCGRLRGEPCVSLRRPAGADGEQDRFAALIRNDSPLADGSALFYLAGLLLAFTPCVLPMVPILSGIIAGGGQQQTTGRAFMLSLTYVLGMAITYTAAGLGRRRPGEQIQALFQQWWVLALFAALFVAMALSMFGLFTVQMPAAIQTRIAP